MKIGTTEFGLRSIGRKTPKWIKLVMKWYTYLGGGTYAVVLAPFGLNDGQMVRIGLIYTAIGIILQGIAEMSSIDELEDFKPEKP